VPSPCAPAKKRHRPGRGKGWPEGRKEKTASVGGFKLTGMPEMGIQITDMPVLGFSADLLGSRKPRNGVTPRYPEFG